MNKSHLLLFSGGVDSVLCLKLLIDNKITPNLLHFRTKKLTDEHENMIMRNAERLSPDSPIMTVNTNTVSYVINLGDKKEDDWTYRAHVKEDKSYLYPAQLADVIYIGYYRINDMSRGKESGLSPKDFDFVIDELHANVKFRFPLEFFTRTQIDKLFMELPVEVREDTLSSTRGLATELGAKVVREPDTGTIEPIVSRDPNNKP